MKLLCDHMLGSLAKWLRILGVDTFYPTAQMRDDELLHIAKQEHRMIISRDKVLIARGKKEKLGVLQIQTTDLNDQLHQVLEEVMIDPSTLLTRCTVCNTLLRLVEKNEVKDYVPPKVFEAKDEFWYCSSCTKYYWMGTHYKNMVQKIKSLPLKKE